MQTKLTFSAAYRQLADIFEALETSQHTPDLDFGADVTGCFRWYVSPKAVIYLNKKNLSSWLFLKHNSQFRVKFEAWEGQEGVAAIIQLNV